MKDRALKSPEWREQWSIFQDNERFLFEEWIAPVTLDDLAGKTILEAGCGGGQHTSFMAPQAKSIVAVDLNTADIAQERNRHFDNVRFVDADIATMELDRQFDVVICIGVIHHTDDPDRTFANLYRHLKPGATIVIWTYSSEGNRPVRFLVEPIRRLLLRHLPRSGLVLLSRLVTAGLYPLVYTVYRLSIFSFLPYYEYFRNFRRLGFGRNVLNVFDKLNAPQTRFTNLSTCMEWFSPDRFEPASISIRRHLGVSYSLSGTRRLE